MKKKYEEAELDIMLLCATDVITTSGETTDGGDGNYSGSGWTPIG